MDSNVAENINILAKFLGTRDIDVLNQEELFERYGIHQADVMVLFGGSIVEGGDVLASGIKNFVAKKYIIVGGAGHTTDTLRQVVHLEYPDIETTEERYVNLLMGEIPRLSDDANGYGPNGKNYIAHVDIPENVMIAFEELKLVFGSETREANPLYASKVIKK